MAFRTPKPIGPFLLLMGVVALLGSWWITDPTNEKTNMVTGAVVFLFLFTLTLIVNLHNEVMRLRSQVDGLLGREAHSGQDESEETVAIPHSEIQRSDP